MSKGDVALWISIASALVAGLAALYARQQVDQAKRANDRLDALDAAEKDRNRVRWVVERVTAGTRVYVLRNVGTETALDVRVWTLSSSIMSGPFEEVPAAGPPGTVRLAAGEVPQGGSIRFSLADPSAHFGSGYELLATWRGHDEPAHVPIPSA